MPIQVGCSKGCGTTIEVSDEQLQEFIDMGQPIVVGHEVCPTEQDDIELSTFRIVIEVYRLVPNTNERWEKMASMGGKVDAKNFSDALPDLAKELDHQWQQIQANAQVIDGS